MSGPITFEAYFSKRDPRSKDTALCARRITGAFDECLSTLLDWQREGRNIYMRVNEGGSTHDSIVRIRAISIEFDAPEAHHRQSQVLPDRWHIPPSLIVRRGRSVHAHWLVQDCPVAEAEGVQRRLQRFYGSDPNAVGNQRVWRVPGFAHPEYSSQEVELYVSDSAMESIAYSLAELEAGLPQIADTANAVTSVAVFPPGETTTAEFRHILSFINPSFNDDYNRWAGLAKVILSGQIPISDRDNYDGEALLDDWCSGRLWVERTGDQAFEAGGYHSRDHLLNEISDETREDGRQIALGSFIWEAKKNGYVQPIRANAVSQNGRPPFTVSVKTGMPLKDFPNALIAARYMPAKPELDEFNHRVVFRGSVPWSEQYGRTLDDELVRAIRVYFLSAYGLDATKENVSEAVLTVAAFNRFHPVREYLRGLEWDGHGRIGTWLIGLCGVEDTPYARAVSRKFLIGAVKRVMDPGCKFDTVLTLEGLQGAGKSTVARILASDDWFTDNVAGDLGQADAIQSLQGRWIAEMAELDSLSRGQLTTVKAFLSRTTDRARFAYERHAADYPRQCVFIATTNEGAFLRDPTGNRRFWPVTVGQICLEELQAVRDQLWAEAMVAIQAGESLELPKELWPEAAAQQEERYAADPWEDIILTYVNGLTVGGRSRDRVHSSELLTLAVGVIPAQQNQNHSSRLKNLMTKRLGWEYRRQLRVSGRLSSGYVRGSESKKENDNEQA